MIRAVSGVVVCLGGTAIAVGAGANDQPVAAGFGVLVSWYGLYLIWTWRR